MIRYARHISSNYIEGCFYRARVRLEFMSLFRRKRIGMRFFHCLIMKKRALDVWPVWFRY
jgi:hypothetical protein